MVHFLKMTDYTDFLNAVNVNYQVDVSDIETSDADSDFFEMVMLEAFPRAAKVIRKRPDYFEEYRDNEFLDKFRLTKTTVRFLIRLIEDKIASPTTR